MDPGVLAVVVGVVLLGCTLQRTSGMGTGLVVSPAFVLVIGPVAGVMLTNITTVVSATLLTVAMRRDIDWRQFARIAPTVVLGSLPAAWVVREVDVAWLEVVIGGALLLALTSVRLVRGVPDLGTVGAGLTAGVAGGFLNTAVGVAAPAMLIYAHAIGWAQRSFAATLQPLFLTMGLVSLGTKVAVGAASTTARLPSWPLVVAAVVAVPLGVTVGGQVARRVTPTTARRAAVVLVTIGAAATLVRGLAGLG